MLALYTILATASAQFPPAAPAAQTCPGDGSKRVWYACTGQEFRAPTAAETTSGVTVANQVCCTAEFDFECLCCLDFSVPLQRCAPGQEGSFCLSRCGAMDLDAANEPPGSPLSMEDDAQVPIPHHAGYGAAAQAPPGQVVVVCSKETAVGALAAQQSGNTPVQLPLECIPREFTPGEIQGTQPDLETGVGIAPGQAILDERIDFLIQNGIPAADVPTCTKTYEAKGGMCPADTPKGRTLDTAPNSAGADALSRVGYVATEQEQEAAVPFLQKKDKMVRRSRGRTFPDLADMTKEEVEKILGEKKTIAFSIGKKVVNFTVDQVSTDSSSLTLAGGGKKVVVSPKSTLFTDGTATEEVERSTTVITMTVKQETGRRGGGGTSPGSFTLSSGSNTAGND